MITADLEQIEPMSGLGSFAKLSAFAWAMFALAVLDLVLVFWLINPVADIQTHHAAKHARATQEIADVTAVINDTKPSPLGSVAVSTPTVRAARRVVPVTATVAVVDAAYQTAN